MLANPMVMALIDLRPQRRGLGHDVAITFGHPANVI